MACRLRARKKAKKVDGVVARLEVSDFWRQEIAIVQRKAKLFVVVCLALLRSHVKLRSASVTVNNLVTFFGQIA